MTHSKSMIVITGASRGIGAALAQHYSQAGHPVLAVGRTFDDTPLPGTIRVQADLSTPEGIQTVVDAARQSGRAIWVLINNAGVQNALDFSTPPDATAIAREIAINLTAPVQLAGALIPLMQRPGGTIVNVTSLVALHPKPSAPVYSATKAGLASFTRALRHQVEPMGLNVAEVLPPLVDTQMTAGRGKGKMSAGDAAGQIARGIAQGERVIAPGMAARVVTLNRIAPALIARILAKT